MGLVAALSYGARFTAGTGPTHPDLLFRYATAIGTLAIDGALLAAMLLIARGLPLRDAFALRAPVSWPHAVRLALLALAASWGTSLVIELVARHALRDQAVPQFWDASRLGAYLVNAVVIAVFVPIVEESACRGMGFTLFLPYGERAAILVTAIVFALAHGAVLDLPWVLVTGLGLSYLRARSGSLYPSVLLHATVNGVAVVASALAAAST